MSADDDDDPVVAEYPVYVAQELTGSLHLFQYPLRRASNPYQCTSRSLQVTSGLEGGSSDASTVPSPTSRFSMEMRLDVTGSDSFAKAAEDDDDPDDDVLGGRGGQRGGDGAVSYALDSVPCKLQSSYVAALFVKGGVHLTPLTSVQQFTPRIRGAASTDNFLSSLSDDVVSTSAAMHSHLERQLGRLRSVVLTNDAKTARPIDLYEPTSVESGTVARRLLSPSMDRASATGGGLRPLPDPLSHYFPLEQCGAQDDSFRLTRQTLLRYAHLTHPVNEQLKALLQSANQLSMRRALDLVKPLAVPQLDPALQQAQGLPAAVMMSFKRYAVLVHGVWVASYDTNFRGSLAFLREHVLHTFAHSADGRITAEAASVAVRGHVFLERGVRQILESLAVLDRATKTWTLQLASAEESQWLTANYPEEVEAQRLQWTRRAADIVSNLQAIASGKTLPNRYLKLPIQAGVGGAMASGAPASPVRARPQGTFAAASQPPTQPSGGSVVAGQAMRPEDVEAKRQVALKFLRLTLNAIGVVNRERMKEHLRAAVQTPQSILHGCPATIVQKAAQESLTTFTSSTWILKSVDTATDGARRALVAAMRAKPAFTAKQIAADAEALLTEALRQQNPNAAAATIPTTVVLTVLKELAEYRNGERLWHIKTGTDSLDPPPPGTLK